MEIYSHHLHTKPVPPSERVNVAVPKDLEGLIPMCLEKDPDHRPKSAASLLNALRKCEDFGAWTENDARSWWKDKRAQIMSLIRKNQAQESSSDAISSTPDSATHSADFVKIGPPKSDLELPSAGN